MPILTDRRTLLNRGLGIAVGSTFGGVLRPVGSQTPGARERGSLPAPDEADVFYTAERRPDQTLDIYLPSSSTGSVPLVVWIHGGGWHAGDKERIGVPYLLDDGYAIASINYRLMPDFLPPAQIQDANAAVTWLVDHAKVYGFDIKRLVLGGSSAGGRSTGLAGLSANNAVEAFGPPPDIRYAALLDFFGGYDNRFALDRLPGRVGGVSRAEVEESLATINTLDYIDGDDPPVLIVHGEEDTVVPIEESEVLAAELASAGVDVEFERVPEVGHGIGRFQSPHIKEVVRGFLAARVVR